MTFDPQSAGWFRDPESVGFEVHMGMFWEKHDADGSPRFGLLLGPEHVNSRGWIHGGVFTAFADHMFGHLARRAAKRRGMKVATISLSSNFVGAAERGEFLEGKAEIIREGRSMIFLQGRIYAGSRIILSGDAVFAVQPDKSPATASG